MPIERLSPCKINLILNILGCRPDGFHELETLLQPVGLHDRITFARQANGIELTCSDPRLPTDATNLVVRAAEGFRQAVGLTEGFRLHLEKQIPLAAGLGGGSGNAATTLLGLNDLCGHPLAPERLHELAAGLGSDVPFFLQSQPAIGTGRGDQITPLLPSHALAGASLLLIHPGFGISTPWAYRELARFPTALHGTPGRAQELARLLQSPNLCMAGAAFYNSLEAPAFDKFPVLALYQEFLREQGAVAALMSGSGSTTFALFDDRTKGEAAREKFLGHFGATCWTALVPATA